MDERIACPACGRDLLPVARKCRCGERLDPSVRPGPVPGPGLGATLLLGALLLLALAAATGLVAVEALPNLLRLSERHEESQAVEGLRRLIEAQTRFHAELGTYADLETLGRAGLIPADLASGLRDGYAFEVAPSRLDPTARWMATASPARGDQDDRPTFAANHTGAVYVREGPIPLDPVECALPPDALPLELGRP